MTRLQEIRIKNALNLDQARHVLKVSVRFVAQFGEPKLRLRQIVIQLVMSQIFFFCTLYDGNATFVYKCKADSELCCGQGCCSVISSAASVWSQWYFWFGIAIFAVLVVGIFLTLTSSSCRPQPIYTENMAHSTASRYGIRHILGVQQSRVTNVAATGVVRGPTGLIQPAVVQSKLSMLNSANHRESVGLAPLRPPYPLQSNSNAGRFDHPLVTDDIV